MNLLTLPIIGLFTLSLLACKADPEMQTSKDLDNPTPSSADSTLVKTDSAPLISSGSVLVLDPQTGEPVESVTLDDLTPFTVDLQVLPSGEEPIQTTVLPDGTTIANVGDRFMRPLVVTMGCDGKINKASHQPSLQKQPKCDDSNEGKNQ